jgi:hypothetical protein
MRRIALVEQPEEQPAGDPDGRGDDRIEPDEREQDEFDVGEPYCLRSSRTRSARSGMRSATLATNETPSTSSAVPIESPWWLTTATMPMAATQRSGPRMKRSLRAFRGARRRGRKCVSRAVPSVVRRRARPRFSIRPPSGSSPDGGDVGYLMTIAL